MNEIGLKFREKREEDGLSVSEVAEDLKVEESDIECLEDGNKDHFSDIYILKDLISNYAKYLGFDSEEVVDKFNEYMFSATSRISLDDIEKAKKLKQLSIKNDVSSPYTNIKTNKKNGFVYGIIIFVILLIVFFVSYVLVNKFLNTRNNYNNISYVEWR